MKPFRCFVFGLFVLVVLDVSQNEKDNREKRTERACNRYQPAENERANTKDSNEMVWVTELGIMHIRRRSHAANQLENDRKTDESKTSDKTNATAEKIQHDDFCFFLWGLCELG